MSQPWRGRGRGRGKGRGGFRFRGRGRGYGFRGRGRGGGFRGKSKASRPNASWKVCEIHPSDTSTSSCKIDDNTIITFQKDADDIFEKSAIYDVKSNKWNVFNIENNAHILNWCGLYCNDSDSSEMYLLAQSWGHLKLQVNDTIDARVRGRWYEAIIKYHKPPKEPLPKQPKLKLSETQEKMNIEELEKLEAIFIHYKQEPDEEEEEEEEEDVTQNHDEWIFIDPKNMICHCSFEYRHCRNEKHRLAPPTWQSDRQWDGWSKKKRSYSLPALQVKPSPLRKHGIFKLNSQQHSLELLKWISSEMHLKLMFVRNNTLHLFVYNDNLKKMQLLKFIGQQLKTVHEFSQLNFEFTYAIYVKSKDKLVLIRAPTNIYEINLQTNVVEKITISQRINPGKNKDKYKSRKERVECIAINAYNDCIIISDGSAGGDNQDIYIYNIDERQIRKSKIQLTAYECDSLIVNNELHLISSENHFSTEMKNIIPHYWLDKNSNEKHNQNISKRLEQKETHMKDQKQINNEFKTQISKLQMTVDRLQKQIKSMEQKQQKLEMLVSDISNKENDDLKENDPKREVKQWLTGFGLLQYYSCFISNGYDSLEFIKGIENKQELFEIGIKLKGHQTQLMIQINKLKEYNNNSMSQIEGVNVVHTFQ